MKTKLSPFAYKVKGNRNHLLFDSLKRQMYVVSPEGDPLELESQLLENDLIIKTDGVIPFKFIPKVDIYKSDLILRELQLRITGDCHLNCAGCGEIGKCIKDGTNINREMVDVLSGQLKSIRVENLTIIGGNPLMKMKMAGYIKSKIKASHYTVLSQSLEKGEFQDEIAELEKTGTGIVHSLCKTGKIAEENMSVDLKEFFYNKQYNPCWGNKLAMDTNGDIKPCIWSGEILGNIKKDYLVNLILTEKCDEFWAINKEKIEICMGCEYRYSCSDCRVKAEKESGNLYSKTYGCSYDPAKGHW